MLQQSQRLYFRTLGFTGSVARKWAGKSSRMFMSSFTGARAYRADMTNAIPILWQVQPTVQSLTCHISSLMKLFTSAMEVMFLPLCVCLSVCQQDNSRRCVWIMKFFWRGVLCKLSQNLQLCRSCGLCHGRQVQIWKISGILMYWGSKIALSYWLCSWALPQYSVNALPVIGNRIHVSACKCMYMGTNQNL